MATVRNLIVGCDGTWNDTQTSAPTNVVKLLDACAARNQVTHYEEGVGTAHLEALPGGIYGKGLDRQILGGYRFLRKRFADAGRAVEDNRVFIFGFSRGAYAARRLAGLISLCGLPKKDEDVELAWQLYLKQDVESPKALKENGSFFDISVQMVGVWDTVKTTTDEDFNDNMLPACVLAGYHAMAIDEKRKFFPAMKWVADERVVQRWFPGVHSDVGGGYEECGLSNSALLWMIECAYNHGLNFKASAVKKITANPNDVMHDSYDGIWKAFGTRKRYIAQKAVAHPATRQRIAEVADYKPANLPSDITFKS